MSTAVQNWQESQWGMDVTAGVEFVLKPLRYRLAGSGAPRFDNALTGETVEQLDVIILMTRVARFAYDQTGVFKSPFCLSVDGGLHGSPRDFPITPPWLIQAGAPVCATCDLNRFGTGKIDDAGKRRGKACTEKRALLMLPAVPCEPEDAAEARAILERFAPQGKQRAAAVARISAMSNSELMRAAAAIWQPDPENSLPLLLNAPVKSLAPVDGFLSGLIYGAMHNPLTGAKTSAVPAYAIATTLTVTRIDQGKDSYGVLTLKAAGWIDPQHAPSIVAQRAKFGPMLGAILEAAEDETAEQQPGQPVDADGELVPF